MHVLSGVVSSFVFLLGVMGRGGLEAFPMMPSPSVRDRPYSLKKPRLFLSGEKRARSRLVHSSDSNSVADDDDKSGKSSRRRGVIKGIMAAASLSAPTAAVAAIPEIDPSGQLFSPKQEMLSGGSSAARGIPLKGSRTALQPGETLQTLYSTRFITYLARFLLNFDPAARSWWTTTTSTLDDQSTRNTAKIENTFAEFAESVEVGLSDYFVGPYGSYATPPAATAGLLASNPAPSLQPETRRGIIEKLFRSLEPSSLDRQNRANYIKFAEQGLLNLFTLLQARYTSLAAKQQLAILFSFVTAPELQPTDQIRGLLGEADNATISRIEIVNLDIPVKESTSRTSARRGGGYRLGDFPTITIESPPPLGDAYQQPSVHPMMEPTSRIFCIDVVDKGEGYTRAPQVTVLGRGYEKPCQACALLDRNGHIESIIVLDPGYGYRKDSPPKVRIEPPKVRNGRNTRRATAVASLEYEIVGIDILDGGSGYIMTEPPAVTITPPTEDPDWFIQVQEQPELRMKPIVDEYTCEALVTEMTKPGGGIVFSIYAARPRSRLDRKQMERISDNPLELLPSFMRPELRYASNTNNLAVYAIPSLPTFPHHTPDNPRFRAQDPLFGSIGKVPVTKGARALSTSEYARLALSGAVCTVLVRTALNPLELIKTKQQLENDEELFAYARSRFSKSEPTLNRSDSLYSSRRISQTQQGAKAAQTKTSTNPEEKLGILDVIQALVSLRGFRSLFQSADITFLASLVFGSFGFGATELFRRSFSSVFFENSSALGNEITLLLAAAFATVITAVAASPFEVLRVRSMGMLEEKRWTSVLQDSIRENSGRSIAKPDGSLNLQDLRLRDVLPLWSGFAPILSRELPFAVTKFLVFDLIASAAIAFLNGQAGEGALPLQIGVGPVGLSVSAAAGAIAGIGGAIVSHPADLILTKSSAQTRSTPTEGHDKKTESGDWRNVVKDMMSQEGGLANLFVGLPARATFFFLVIGLQFFLYDYVKTLFNVSSDDLSLVLDVFYAVRQGLTDATTP